MGIGTFGASASVLPVTHKLKLAVGFSDASAAELAPIGWTDAMVSVQPVTLDHLVAVALADIIAPTPCSDAPPVQPVLKTSLLLAWHHLWNMVRWMHRCLSWSCRFNRCFTSFFTWSLEALSPAPMPERRIFRKPSDAPMLWASVLPVLLISVELVQFSVSLSSFFVFCFVWPFYIIPGI